MDANLEERNERAEALFKMLALAATLNIFKQWNGCLSCILLGDNRTTDQSIATFPYFHCIITSWQPPQTNYSLVLFFLLVSSRKLREAALVTLSPAAPSVAEVRSRGWNARCGPSQGRTA